MLNFHYLHKLWKTLASPHLGRGVGASQKSCKFPVWARRPGHLINPLWCNEQWACKRVAILTDIKHNIKQIINIRQKIIFRPFQAPTLATLGTDLVSTGFPRSSPRRGSYLDSIDASIFVDLLYLPSQPKYIKFPYVSPSSFIPRLCPISWAITNTDSKLFPSLIVHE